MELPDRGTSLPALTSEDQLRDLHEGEAVSASPSLKGE